MEDLIPIEPTLIELGSEDVPMGSGWVKMRCFGHQDNHPSATVNHDKGAFTCFSCGRKGDAVKLLMSEQNLTYGEAFRKARYLAGLPETTRTAPTPKRRASTLLMPRG